MTVANKEEEIPAAAEALISPTFSLKVILPQNKENGKTLARERT